MGSLDLPDQPDEASRVEHADADGVDRPIPKSREMPDPDERSRAYEAIRAYVSASTEEVSPDRGLDGTDQPSYWDEVSRYQKMWADHERRWPAKRSAADHSADPPGSYRSDSGFYLNPERHSEAVQAISGVREAEPVISAVVQAIEHENKYGGWLEGFERRLKGEDRLKEKVAEQVAVEPDKPSSEILRKLPDAIRFTCCLQPETYNRGYDDIKARMESLRYEMYQSTNWWEDPEYKGVNTRWVTAEGQRFEVQFHTPESYHAKQYVTHRAYERLRNPQISGKERHELEAFQREVSSRIQIPDGATDIPDFKKEGL